MENQRNGRQGDMRPRAARIAATIASSEPKIVTWSVTQAPCINSGSNSPTV